MQYSINFLQESAPGMGGSLFPLFMIGILVIFYLFFIRPQSKKQKEEKNFRESLTKGDKVMTIGGVYGKVVKVEETSVLVQVDDNTKLRFDKTAIRPMPEPAPAKK
jgi:preprotein translocase subunit YajC